MSTFHSVLAVRYTTAATFTVSLYDFISTLEDEIEFIWPSRLSASKVIYLLNRYVPIVTATVYAIVILFTRDKDTCYSGQVAFSALAVFGYVAAEAALGLRTYAVWQQQKFVIALFAVCILTTIGTSSFTLDRILSASIPIDPELVPNGGCLFELKHSRMVWINLTVVIVIEFIALTMLLTKGFYFYRYTESSLMRMICRDGALFSSCILTSSVVNIILARLLPQFASDILVVPQSVLSNLLCCRLLLRIRHYASDMKDVDYEVTPSLNICAIPMQTSGLDPLLSATGAGATCTRPVSTW